MRKNRTFNIDFRMVITYTEHKQPSTKYANKKLRLINTTLHNAKPYGTGRYMFERLYEKYAGGMWRYACKITHDEQLACDVVQESFVKLMEKEATLRALNQYQLEAYIITTIKHTAYKMAKKQNVNFPLEIDVKDTGPLPEDAAVRIGTREEMQKALAKLPEKYREVISLHYYHGLSYKMIAHALGITENNAHAIAYRARAALRKIFTEDEA